MAKRIHIGGLTESTTESEIIEKFSSFGKVKNVEIKVKKDTSGELFNTFGYMTIEANDSSLQKCFSVFNKTKWKGRTLQLQEAKQHFLSRLEKERTTPEIPVVKKVRTRFHNPLEKLPEAVNFDVKGKVPGTAVPGEKKWIVGKYGRILPIVDVRNKSINRIVRVDPSKYCHNLKKIKIEDSWDDMDLNVEKLTWNIDRVVSKRRCGDFSDYENFYAKRARVSETKDWSEEMEEKMAEMRRRYLNEKSDLVIKDHKDMDIEVVKGPKKSSVYLIPRENLVYDFNDNLSDDVSQHDDEVESNSGDSVGSADTDEIIAMMNPAKQSEYLDTVQFSDDDFVNKEIPQTSALNGGSTSNGIKSDLIKSCVNKDMKMIPFKGISMLDSDEDLDSYSIKHTNDYTDEHMDSSSHSEQENKSEEEESSDTEKDTEMSISKTEHAKDTKQINTCSTVTCFVDKAMKLTPFKGMSMLESSDEESTKTSENLLNKESIELSKVNDIHSKISDNEKTQNDVNSVTSAASFTLSDVKKNLASDSEYDSDDFEKVARKFEANVKNTLCKAEDTPEKHTNNSDLSIQANSNTKSDVVSESSKENSSDDSIGSNSSSDKDLKESSEEDSEEDISNEEYDVKSTQEEKVKDDDEMNNDDKESIDETNGDTNSSSDNDSSDDQSSDDNHSGDNTGQENNGMDAQNGDSSNDDNSDESSDDDDSSDDDSSDEDDNNSDENDDSNDEDDDSSDNDDQNDKSSNDDSGDDTGESDELKTEKDVKTKTKKKKKEKSHEDMKADNFFVSSSLLTAFSKKSNESNGGFSFLKSFGSSRDFEESKEDAADLPWQLKPKNSDNDADMVENENECGKQREGDKTLFFQPNDARLKEGTDFFHRVDPPDVIERKWLEDKSVMMSNCRQRHRTALRKINLEKMKQRQKPQNFAFRGKRTTYH